MRNNEGGELIKAVFVMVSIAVVGAGFYISRSTGATFATSIQAVTWNIVVFILAGVFTYFTDGDCLPPTIAGVPMLIWPAWWPVLDSSACGGCSSDGRGFMPWQVFWWDEWYTKAGGEILLLIVFAWVFFRWANSPRRYY